MEKERVLLYGAGKCGRYAYDLFREEYHIIGFLDRNPNICIDMPGKVYPLSELPELIESFDQIWICIVDLATADEVKEYLHDECGLSENRIAYFKDIKMKWIDDAYRNLWKKAMQEREQLIQVKAVSEEGSLPVLLDRKKRIRVNIYNMERKHVWNSLRSLAIAFEKDSRVDLKVIACHEKDNYDCIRADVQNVVWRNEYDAEKDHADITVVNPTSYICEQQFYKNTKLLCAIPFCNLHFGSIESFLEPVNENFRRGNLECTIFEKNIYHEIRQAGIDNPKLVCMGNPKFDDIYDKCISNPPEELPSNWVKLNHKKKIILYTTTHGLSLNVCTFYRWGEAMLETVRQFPEVGFIFRPHPYFLKELTGHSIWQESPDCPGIWTDEELQDFIDVLNNSASIVFDDSADYSLGYYMADAILTEVGCGIMLSALPLDKPLAVLETEEDAGFEIGGRTLNQGLYHIKTQNDYTDFVTMVLNGEDDNRDNRRRAAKACICNFDGLNGERIKNYLINTYLDKYSRQV